MNVLIVGGGGREHAIAWALSKSEQVEQLYCAPGNGGIAALAQCVPLSATDVDGVVAWAQTHSIDFVVVAPDDPLALGMVDALEDAGIPAFGPRADAAIIEASKIFSKNLMAKYHIPTAKYQTFTELAPALAYIEAEGAPIVLSRLSADKKVFCDCQVGTEVNLLVYGADTFLLCFLGAAVDNCVVTAFNHDFPCFKLLNSCQNFNQRGFSRAVFPDQAVNKPLFKLQTDIL